MCGIMLTTKPWSIANPLRKPSVICHSNAARFWPDEKFASPFNFYRHKAVADAMKRGPAAFGNPYSAQESKSSVRKPLRRDISNCPITAEADVPRLRNIYRPSVNADIEFVGRNGLCCPDTAALRHGPSFPDSLTAGSPSSFPPRTLTLSSHQGIFG
jgi:hypothetical protein